MKRHTTRTQTAFTVALVAARSELASPLRGWLEAVPEKFRTVVCHVSGDRAVPPAHELAGCDVALLAGDCDWLAAMLHGEAGSHALEGVPIVAVLEGDEELPESLRAHVSDELRWEECSAPLVQRALLLALQQRAQDHREAARDESYQGLQDVLAAADELLKFDNLVDLLRRAVQLGVERLQLEYCALYLIENDDISGNFVATRDGELTTHDATQKGQGKLWIRDATPENSERWVVHEVKFDQANQQQLNQEVDKVDHPNIHRSRFLNILPFQYREAERQDQRNETENIESVVGWRASTLIRAAGGVVGIWHNDTRFSGRALDRAQQELVAVYCSLLGNIIERKRADDALRNNERRFRLLTEHATDLIVRMTPKGRILYVSPSCRHTLGYKPEELVGGLVHDWVHPEDVDEAFLFKRRPDALPDIFRREVRVRRHDGSYAWFEAVSRPVLDELGRVHEYQTTARDISERRHAEDALRQSEERFRAFMDNTPAMTFIKDPDGRYVYFNRTTEELSGVKLNELKGNTNFDRMPVEVARQLRDNDRQVLATGQSQEFMEVLPGKDGRNRYWLTFKFPLQGADGRTNIGGVAVDVTERRESEAALGRSEQRLSTVVDSASLVLWAIDREGIFTLSQGQGLQLLGLLPGEVVGQNSFEVYRDYPEICAYLRRALNGETLSTEVTIGPTVFQVRINPLRGENSVLNGALGVAFDITEQRRSQETLSLYTARLENLLEIDRAIRAAHSPATIAAVALKQLCRYLPCHRASVAVFDFETRQARVLATSGADSPYRVGHVYPLNQFTPAESNPDTIERENVNKGPENTHNGDLRRILPLVVQNERVGALELHLQSDLKADDVKGMPLSTAMPLSERWTMASEVAGQLAIAIQQARLFEQVREGKTQLQTLSHRLIQAQETERRNLAHELHDEIGQVLTAVKLNLQHIDRQLEQNPSSLQRPVGQIATHAEPIALQLQHSVQIVEGALQSVRDLSLNLRPSLLDDLGLGAALRWYVDRMTARLPVTAQLIVDLPEERPAPEVETACFRIAQEALTNAIRHSNALNICIEVSQHALPATCPHPPGMRNEESEELHEIALTISDDGCGFDVRNERAHAAGSSLGLPGMEERAALVDGRLVIDSAPGQGTQVRAYFPL